MSWVPTTNNLDSGGSEIARFNLHLSHNNVFYFDFGGRAEVSGGDAAFNKNSLFCFKRSGTEMSIRLNGQQIVYSSSIAGNILNSNFSPFVVGKLRTDSGYQFEGLIGEIIVYGNGLHANEIQKIEAYLAKKWGIKI